MKLLIGNRNYSSWSLRAWLALRHAGLPFEEQVNSLFCDEWTERRKGPDFAPANGKVPILWDGPIVVWESLAIIDYLDDKTGRTRGFWPADPVARALARSMAAEMHAGYAPLRSRHSMNLRRTFAPQPVDAEVAADIERICALWADARTRFGAGGDYLFGAWSAADIMFAPVATRFLTYSFPISTVATDYCGAVIAHPDMADWVAAAKAESWVIEKFEGARQG